MTDGETRTLWHTCVAGGVSGIVSRLLVYPFDTIKSRLCVQGEGGSQKIYRSTAQALATVVKREGPFSLYSGFGVVALCVVPGNMAYFSGYELGSSYFPSATAALRGLAAGVLAQLLGGIVYTPMDVIKERLQVKGMMGSEYASRLLTTVKGTAAEWSCCVGHTGRCQNLYTPLCTVP
eukprot:evm.model.scf_754.2 EVM.evm.TU.scf_754.2   scf_754:34379-34912(-)